ncbi:MAG: GGDEF domain-containing protein [Clostridia bacterium]|nr:GGDEF domain-containing protein [Clostridia bacterium]
MRRKVAIFANGWSDEQILNAMSSIKECANENDIELQLFVEYASISDLPEFAQGYLNILNLPNLEDYDGVFLFGNTLNNRGELDILVEKIKKANVPAVCLEYQVDGIDCFCTDNYTGMRELCEHIVNEHHVKKVAFVSGDDNNLENIERRKALEDVLEEHGLSLDPEDVVQGGWSYHEVHLNVPKYVEKRGLPDAFVCANDIMAMGTILILGLHGYCVPDDVLVTGFDNTTDAKAFNPIITSVDRDCKDLSYDAMQRLVDVMNGAPVNGLSLYKSKMSLGESCGCTMSRGDKRNYANLRNNAFSLPVKKTIFDWHLASIDELTHDEVNSLEAVNNGFRYLFRNINKPDYNAYEGYSFCICLDESFLDTIFNQGTGRFIGYGDKMCVIYCMDNRKSLDIQYIDKSYIFPKFEETHDGPSTYVIAPIHDKSLTIGYAVFKDSLRLIDMTFLTEWLKHIAKMLLRARVNIRMEIMHQKLQEISYIDELSGLLNRKGYEKKAIPFLEQIRVDGKTGILMVVDINRMKDINDRYGHLQGDTAIRIVSKAIKSIIPKEWYAVRYGGDEFVILGEKVFVDNGDIIMKQLCDEVKRIANEMMISFELTVSVGSVIITPNESIVLDEYFKYADNAMYEMKKKQHNEVE